MHLTSLDHLVLTVRDLEATGRFYEQVLGMRRVVFGPGRMALQVGQQMIKVHQQGHEFAPKATCPTPGSADLCFLTDVPLPAVMAHLKQCGVELEEGIVQRTGAQGAIASLYLRDPDGNLVEVSTQLDP